MIDKAQKEIVKVISRDDLSQYHNFFEYTLEDGLLEGASYQYMHVSRLPVDNMVAVLLHRKDLSFSKPGLPNNIAKIFLTGDLVTFVYLDGKVEMKPANCLGKSEKDLVKQVRADVGEVQDKLKSSGTNPVGNRTRPPTLSQQMENLNQQMKDMKAQLQMIIGVPSQGLNVSPRSPTFQGRSPSYGFNPRPMNNFGRYSRETPHEPNFQSHSYSGNGAQMYGPSDSDDEF